VPRLALVRRHLFAHSAEHLNLVWGTFRHVLFQVRLHRQGLFGLVKAAYMVRELPVENLHRAGQRRLQPTERLFHRIHHAVPRHGRLPPASRSAVAQAQGTSHLEPQSIAPRFLA